MIIRTEIRPGDIGSIIKLHGEYYSRANGFDATFEPYVAVPLSEFVIRHKENERIWIVEKGGEVRGSIAIVDAGNASAQLRWYIVSEELQGRGIGKRLIDAAIRFSKEQKYGKIILWTVDEQKAAIDIYRKNGFTLIEEKRHFLWGKELNEQCYQLELR